MLPLKPTLTILPLITLTVAYTGSITYFIPGLGACGSTSSSTDPIVAISSALFDSDSLCGRTLRVSSSAGSADVTVVDRCAGCAQWDLDLSPSAFEASVGDLSIGRADGTWEWL